MRELRHSLPRETNRGRLDWTDLDWADLDWAELDRAGGEQDQMLTSSDIKRALRDAGLEVYRAQGNAIHVAERVRENLILDSGIRIVIDGDASANHQLIVTFVAEAPRSQFPGDEREALFDRARRLGGEAIDRGFVEEQERVAPVEDPSDAARVLDERFQVAFTKRVASIEAAVAEVRFVLSLSRSVER